MTVSFVSRNKKLEPLDDRDKDGPVGWCWSWLLDEGAGLPIGLAKGDGEDGFIYAKERWSSGYYPNPYNGGGAYVTAEEAKTVADCIDMICLKYEYIADKWDKLSSEEKQLRENLFQLYTKPVRKDYTIKGRKLADWMRQSNGFTIN